MAKKKKKKSENKVSLSDTESNGASIDWPDLPRPLLNLFSGEPNLSRKIYSKGATKSWVIKPSNCNTSTFSCSSWLQPFHLEKENLKHDMYRRRCRWKWHKILWEWDFWPRWWGDNYLGTVFSSDPAVDCPFKDICTAMVFTGISSPAFGFHHLGPRHLYSCTEHPRDTWNIQDCNIVDPYCSNPYERRHFMRFTNAIGFKGKFYAVTLQGTLVVIEENNGCFGITRLCNRRVVPSVSSKHYRECLLESDGRILVVFLISRTKSVQIVDDVEVYRLDEANLRLTKLESLGDAALFLGADCCTSISARRLPGCNRNSVYFKPYSADDWWAYDFQTGTISPAWQDSSPMNSTLDE